MIAKAPEDAPELPVGYNLFTSSNPISSLTKPARDSIDLVIHSQLGFCLYSFVVLRSEAVIGNPDH